jgi:hypothetical protein
MALLLRSYPTPARWHTADYQEIKRKARPPAHDNRAIHNLGSYRIEELSNVRLLT